MNVKWIDDCVKANQRLIKTHAKAQRRNVKYSLCLSAFARIKTAQ
jgi:hypothetical protein